jgi:hypothetical protein
MKKESFAAEGMGSSNDGAENNAAGVQPEIGSSATNSTSDQAFAERRQSNRRQVERRMEERRMEARREEADRRAAERRFLTMEALEEKAENDPENDSVMRREGGGLWPSLDWRPGDQRMTQRRDSERRINDRRYEDRRKTDRRQLGRRASDQNGLYHGQVQLDEDIDDLFEAGDYKGSAD